MGILSDVKPGDWLTVNVRGVSKLEKVTSTSQVSVVTEHYRFAKSGIQWPAKTASISARPAMPAEIEKWLRWVDGEAGDSGDPKFRA
ncbi:hypothetical protein [Acidobacterium sp. S8]|uniref:hypothetical protein n=1 Tax=Acidobacterium sp. S8 TaxID=1641854 RepID=UPI00131ADFBB|nr:hypothetical protein [Acidobacterium sp. S8]